MVDGRQNDAWNHTASLLAQIHNANPFHRRALQPADFLPGADDQAAGQEMTMGEAAAFFGSR